MANEKPEKPGGEKISKAEAAKMTKAYDEKNKGKTRSVAYSAKFVRELVNNPKAETVWLYFAENDKGENTIVISTADANNQILDDADRGSPCPPYCPS